MKRKSDFLVKSAVIAAAYTVLTLLLAPLSYGAIQVRVSEGLIGLAVFTPAAIPGITIGCFLSGILGPNGIVDAVIGSLASLIGCIGTYAFRKYKYAASLANVVSNSIAIGLMMYYIYDVKINLFLCIGWIALGELIACMGIGNILIKYLSIRDKKVL